MHLARYKQEPSKKCLYIREEKKRKKRSTLDNKIVTGKDEQVKYINLIS